MALQPNGHVAGVFERRAAASGRPGTRRPGGQRKRRSKTRQSGVLGQFAPQPNQAIPRYRAGRGVCRLVRYVPRGVVIFGRDFLDPGGVDGTSGRTPARRLVRGPKFPDQTLQRWCEGTGR